MVATVYINAKTQQGLIAENVKVLSISQKPRITKNGKLFKQPFEGGKYMTQEQSRILCLWEQGIRVADVVYPDGTHDINVWVNVDDIKE